MATPRNAFRTPRANQENGGITNRLLSKGGLLSERKHGSVKQAFGDVKNTFQPTNNGGQNFQKQTPMKVFNKQNENTKVMTPSVKQNTNLREKSLGKCSYKTIKDERYYWYKNAAWTDEQMDIFIKKANQEPVYEEVVLLPVTKEIPYTFDLMDISLPTELPEIDMALLIDDFNNDFPSKPHSNEGVVDILPSFSSMCFDDY